MKKIATIFLIILTATCNAQIFTVDDDGPADFNNIQSAIDASEDGDVIIVNPGIYKGNGNRDIDFLGKAITVRSIDPNDPNIVKATVIDCNGSESIPHRGFIFHNNEDTNSTLAGFTIINGYIVGSELDNCGGAIYCEGSTPRISDCIVKGNRNQIAGGGIACVENSDSIIERCIISDNHAEGGGGGGIFCYNSSPVINNCTIKDNLAYGYGGGGIACWNFSSPTINNCTISNNVAFLINGGGIFCNNSSPTVYNCTIRSNSAHKDGGGISCWTDSDLKIQNCSIVGNFSTLGPGGGVAVHDANPTVKKCKVKGNYSGSAGGGISLDVADVNIVNCTIAGNSCEYFGGGIFFELGELNLDNSIIWDNIASDGQEVGIFSWSGVTPQIPDSNLGHYSYVNISYSNIKNGEQGIYVFGDPNWLILGWSIGNLDTDPCFVNADANDYHLKSQSGRWDPNTQDWVYDDVTSPCIDAGNPGCPLASEPNDINNVRINMGAYGGTPAASKTPLGWALLADLTNDCFVDFNDFSYQANDWLKEGQCQPGDLNRDKKINLADISLFLEDWLETAAQSQP